MKVPIIRIQWVELVKEHEEPILNDKEKKYLSAVIAPFKKKVECIKKVPRFENYEYIVICVKSRDDNDCYEIIDLPKFEKGRMYEGMGLWDEYTIQELGL